MIIDILFALTLVLALIKGYQRGLIAGVFSLLAIVLGLAAALKLSAWATGWLAGHTTVDPRWLPLIAFLAVFAVVVILVRLGAKAIESAVEVVQLGWLNKTGGILLYLFMYILVFSVFLFYATSMHVFKTETIRDSLIVEPISPFGPAIINGLASLIPWFSDMFATLTRFFEQLSGQLPQ